MGDLEEDIRMEEERRPYISIAVFGNAGDEKTTCLSSTPKIVIKKGYRYNQKQNHCSEYDKR